MKLLWPALTLVLACSTFAQGDNCASATAIAGTGSFTFDTTLLGTSTTGFGGLNCFSDIYRDVFWQWTAPAAGDYTFDTFGSNFDTKLNVHGGSGCTATCLDSNDDAGGSTQSSVSLFGLSVGESILIQVGGFDIISAGSGTLNITRLAATQANDTCGTAATIAGTGTFRFDTSGCSTSGFNGGGTCAGGANSVNQDAFIEWTAPADGTYHVDTLGTTWDTKLSVHSGGGCAASCTGFSDDINYPSIVQSEVGIFNMVMGEVLLIQVGGYSVNEGPGMLNITADACTGVADDALEENDTCFSPYVHAGGSVGWYVGLFLTETDPDFFSITIPANQIMTAGLVDVTGDVDVFLYDTNCSLIGPQSSPFVYSNNSGAPETVILECRNNSLNGTQCATYSLGFWTEPDPCLGVNDSLENNDDCATAVPVSEGTYAGLVVSKTDKDHYSACVPDGGTVTFDLLFHQVDNTDADIDGFLRTANSLECGTGNGANELAEGFSATSNETITWTNTTGAAIEVVLEVNIYPGSSKNCNTYDMVVAQSGHCAGSSAGSTFCTPAADNSTGAPAVLAGTWGSGGGSDLHLEMTGGVPGQLAYMLVGNEVTLPFLLAPSSDGPLCLYGTLTARLYRFNVLGTPMNSVGGFDASGRWMNAAGTSSTGFGFDVPSTIPDLLPIPVLAGDTWHFQGWYRDTASGIGHSNFSSGLSVTF